ncbi:hypothetical protein ABVT39_017380 [Epinephelus coioides]
MEVKQHAAVAARAARRTKLQYIQLWKEYAEARRILKEKNPRSQFLYPARLKVYHEDGFKVYDTVEDATADLARRGLPVEVVKPVTVLEKLLCVLVHDLIVAV